MSKSTQRDNTSSKLTGNTKEECILGKENNIL